MEIKQMKKFWLWFFLIKPNKQKIFLELLGYSNYIQWFCSMFFTQLHSKDLNSKITMPYRQQAMLWL